MLNKKIYFKFKELWENKNIFELKGKYENYELVYFKDVDYPCKIYETIVFDNSSNGIKNWYFISKKNNQSFSNNFNIKKKNKNTLNDVKNIKKALGLEVNLTPIYNINNKIYNYFKPNIYVFFKNGERLLLNNIEYNYFNLHKKDDIDMIQFITAKNPYSVKLNNEYLLSNFYKINNIESEVKLYKISLKYKKYQSIINKLKTLKKDEIKDYNLYQSPNLNMFLDFYLRESAWTNLFPNLNFIARQYYNKNLEEEIFLFQNIEFNEIIKKKTLKIIKFFEYSLKINIQYINIMYRFEEKDLVFLGVKNLLFKSKISSTFQQISLDELKEKNLYIKNDNYYNQSNFNAKSNNQISNKLLKTWIIDKCQGDFCNFFVLQNYKEKNFQIKDQSKQLKNLPIVNRMINKYANNKNFNNITNNLIYKIRDNPVKYFNILKKNNFYPEKIEGLQYDEFYKNKYEDNLLYFLNQLSKKNQNKFNSIDLKYKNVKVCEICYSIYILSQKYEEKEIKSKFRITHSKGNLSKNSKYLSNTNNNFRNNSILRNRNNTTLYNKMSIGIQQTNYLNNNNKRQKFIQNEYLNLRVNFIKKIGFNVSVMINKIDYCVNLVNDIRKFEFKVFIKKINNLEKIFDTDSSNSLSKLIMGDLYKELITKFSIELNNNDNNNSTVFKKIRNKRISMVFICSSIAKLVNVKEQKEIKKIEKLQKKNFKIFKKSIIDKFEIFHKNIKEYNIDNYKTSVLLYDNRSKIKIPFTHLNQKFLLPNKSLYLCNKYNYNDFKAHLKLLSLEQNTNMDNINIKILYYNNFTSIPYYIINNEELFKNIEDSFFSEECENKKILIVFQDIFDNFLKFNNKKIKFFKNFKKIILFQYPGQAYTTYSNDRDINNQFISEIFDNLLYNLNISNNINILEDEFTFLGFGYGGNILLHYWCYFELAFPNLNNIIIINSFYEIDNIIENFFKDYLKELNKDKNIEDENYPFYFYNSLVCNDFNSDNLENKFKDNPISIDGRKLLIKGLLNCIWSKKLKILKIPLLIIHSKINFLVNISHSDKISELFEKNELTKNSINIRYIEGGHYINLEKNDELFQIMNNFIK